MPIETNPRVATAEDCLRFERLLDRVATNGNTPTALWPASAYLQTLAPTTRAHANHIHCIIDDNPDRQGKTFAGLPIKSLDQAKAAGIKSVIACADPALQDRLWPNRHPIRQAGLQLLWCPDRFEPKLWDQTLCDLWDHEQAKANKLNPLWPHIYPPEDHKPPKPYIDYLKAHMGLEGSARVLEVGAGHGLITNELIDHAAEYTVVDFSERLLYEIIEHRFALHLDKLTLQHDETATLAAIPDASIDLALSFDVFVHLQPDIVHQYLAAFCRVLAPSGRACLHVRRWDATEIGVWESSYRDTCAGAWSGMAYNTIDSLEASCNHLGLRLARVGDDDGLGKLEGWVGYLIEVAVA